MDNFSEESNPLRGFWFYPITNKIREFEESSDVFEIFASMAEPESPDWIVQCTWSQMTKYRESAGTIRHDRIRARHVGAMVGAKTSICERLAAGNLWFNKLPRKTQDKFIEIFGEEEVAAAKIIWSEFEHRLRADFRAVRKFASDLAMSQPLWEQVQFHQGTVNGLRFMDEVSAACRKENKQAVNARKRHLVCLFAIEHRDLINAARNDLKWSDLVDGFEQTIYGRHVEIDEQTFKKILQRSGLRVGAVGRPRLTK
jgi:hypothetical protein